MPVISAITVPSNGIDSVCTARGYAGPPGDNTAKLAFVRNYIINELKEIHRNTQRRLDENALPQPTDIVVT